MKIDVDGIEDRVLAGAASTLADPRLRSLLVELDVDREEHCRNVIDRLAGIGLRLSARRHAPEHDGGEFASLYNHIFVRG